MAITLDHQMLAMKTHLRLIGSAKQRYRWLLDPNNSDLTPAQRRRATRVTVSDYVRILKMEDELYKRLERFKAKRSGDLEEPEARTRRRSCSQ